MVTPPPLAPGAAPLPGEAPDAYLERLHAMQRHLGELVDAVERGQLAQPAAPPRARALAEVARTAPPPDLPREGVPLLAGAALPARPVHHVRGPDRREGSRDRRHGARDRRRGRPDLRAQRVERRGGAPDRRSGRPDRRLGGDRRRVERPPRGPALDPEPVFWGVNVVCWAAVTAVAFVWG
jgi:hypothetical protein